MVRNENNINNKMQLQQQQQLWQINWARATQNRVHAHEHSNTDIIFIVWWPTYKFFCLKTKLLCIANACTVSLRIFTNFFICITFSLSLSSVRCVTFVSTQQLVYIFFFEKVKLVTFLTMYVHVVFVDFFLCRYRYRLILYCTVSLSLSFISVLFVIFRKLVSCIFLAVFSCYSSNLRFA